MARKYTQAQMIAALELVASGKSRKDAATESLYPYRRLALDMPQIRMQLRQSPYASDADIARMYLRENGFAA